MENANFSSACKKKDAYKKNLVGGTLLAAYYFLNFHFQLFTLFECLFHYAFLPQRIVVLF